MSGFSNIISDFGDKDINYKTNNSEDKHRLLNSALWKNKKQTCDQIRIFD
jgi:hypothetical protein